MRLRGRETGTRGDRTEIDFFRAYAAVGVHHLNVHVLRDTPAATIAELERVAREVLPDLA